MVQGVNMAADDEQLTRRILAECQAPTELRQRVIDAARSHSAAMTRRRRVINAGLWCATTALLVANALVRTPFWYSGDAAFDGIELVPCVAPTVELEGFGDVAGLMQYDDYCETVR
jgi:hypothetical protein